jgi:PPM family protein phosphatase
MPLSLRFAARSDIGLLRDGNEDSGYAGPHLLCVADGMGGHAAGEVASSIATSCLAPLDDDVPGADLLDVLSVAVAEANERLAEMVATMPSLEGMGTTLTAVLWSGTRLGLAHIGDSRCYLLRDGELLQITNDHTFVQTLVDEGRITAEEATSHPQRSLLTRVLNGTEEVDVDLSVREVRDGDRYLLCSDGLSGVVSSTTLLDSLSLGTPEMAVDALINLALRGGGPDNITCVVADVVDVDSRPSEVPTVIGAAAQDEARRRIPLLDTAAGRAAAALTPDTPLPAESSPTRRRLRARWAVLPFILIVLMTAAGYGYWLWAQGQYFVGTDQSSVAIYRGVNSRLGPVRLASVYERLDISVNDLPTYQHDLVVGSIEAESLADARRITEELRRQTAQCATGPQAANSAVCGGGTP